MRILPLAALGRLAATSLVALGTQLVVAASAGAQLAEPGWTIGAGAAYETYRFTDHQAVGIRSLSLLTLPFGSRLPLAGGLNFEVLGSYGSGYLERADGSSVSIEGFTDTELRLSLPFGRDAVVVTAMVALPTGHSTHTTGEAEVAGAIAADLLPFRISNWGTGGGAGLSTAFARSVAGWGLGASLAYVVAQEFEPLDANDLAYRPGDQLRVRAAIDHPVGTSGRAALQVMAQHFRDDELDGANLYQSGNRYQAMASYAFAAGARSSGIVYAGFLHRDHGTFLSAPAAAVLAGEDIPSQDLMLTGAGFRLPFGRGILLPSVDARLFRRADGEGQGWVTGAGASAEWPLGGITVVPTLRGRVGNLVASDDAESMFTGADLGISVRLRDPR